MNAPQIIIEAYAGYKGEDTPRAMTMDGVRLVVSDIVDRWYSETHCCFRVRMSDGQRYVLRCHLDDGLWELVMRDRS